jgi:hypothetical protein
VNYIEDPEGRAVAKSAYHEFAEACMAGEGHTDALILMGTAYFERLAASMLPLVLNTHSEIVGHPFLVSAEVPPDFCGVVWGRLAEKM